MRTLALIALVSGTVHAARPLGGVSVAAEIGFVSSSSTIGLGPAFEVGVIFDDWSVFARASVAGSYSFNAQATINIQRELTEKWAIGLGIGNGYFFSFAHTVPSGFAFLAPLRLDYALGDRATAGTRTGWLLSFIAAPAVGIGTNCYFPGCATGVAVGGVATIGVGYSWH